LKKTETILIEKNEILDIEETSDFGFVNEE
jgi:hypothetical protein